MKANAAIIYMARSRPSDVSNLKRSLLNLDLHFNTTFQYPVIVFHEDLSDHCMRDIVNSTSSRLTFVRIHFTLPKYLKSEEVPETILGRFGIGYRHMCRFFAGAMYKHPALTNYDWYWRLDTDSFILRRIDYDVFRYMERNDFLYGYIAVLKETPAVVTGLWEATQKYIRENGISPVALRSITTPGGAWNYKYYYNNFEICRLDFGRSDAYQDYFAYLDRLGGIYKYRWGDAPIRTLGLAMLVEEGRVHRFADVAYKHAGYYTHHRDRIRDRMVGGLRWVGRRIGLRMSLPG